jgi:hypothetical protein
MCISLIPETGNEACPAYAACIKTATSPRVRGVINLILPALLSPLYIPPERIITYLTLSK